MGNFIFSAVPISEKHVESNQTVKPIYYIRKKAPSEMFGWVLNTPPNVFPKRYDTLRHFATPCDTSVKMSESTRNSYSVSSKRYNSRGSGKIVFLIHNETCF